MTESQPGIAPVAPAHPTGTLVEFLRRGGVILALCMLVGGAAGLLVTTAVPKQYTATASVLVSATGVDPSVAANGRTAGVINLDTEAQLVKSADVVRRAQQREPLVPRGATGQVVRHLHVSVPANTTVLEIAFTGSTPKVARAAANAFANAYLDDRKATAQSALQTQIDDFNGKADALNNQLKQVTADEQGLPKGSHQLIYDQAQISLLQNQLATLHQSLITLTGTQVTPGRVLTAAPLPHAPSSPKRMLYLGSGLAIGLIVGTLIAWLRVTYRRFARDASDLAHGVDVPLIADVALSRRNLVVDLHSPDAEPYRRLAVVTTSAIGRTGTVVLSATGSTRSGGAVATNLARAIAETGASVCLLRIAGDAPAGPTRPGVIVVAAERVDTLRTRFGGATVRETLTAVRGGADVLLVDAPCPTQTADAQTLAVTSDAVIMTVESGIRMGIVREAVDQFDTVAAPMLGIVLVHTAVGAPSRPRGLMRLFGRRARPRPVRVDLPSGLDSQPTVQSAPPAVPERRPRPVPRPLLGPVDEAETVAGGQAESPEPTDPPADAAEGDAAEGDAADPVAEDDVVTEDDPAGEDDRPAPEDPPDDLVPDDPVTDDERAQAVDRGNNRLSPSAPD